MLVDADITPFPFETWRDTADAMGIRKPPTVFECVGATGLMQNLIDSCEPGSRIYAAGGWYTNDTINVTAASKKGLMIQFAGGPRTVDWDRTLDAVCAGRLDPLPSVGRVIALDAVPAALDEVRRAQGPPRIVVHPNGEPPTGRPLMTYRVALWGTGWAGRQAIPGILGHPDLELAGTYVTDPDKDGRDVGELAGIPPIGLLATSDVDQIMDLRVDCHLVMLLGHRPRTAAAVTERICTILEAGQNVSQTSIVPLYYPEFAPVAMRDQVEAACRRGGSSCYGTGVFPGVMSDVIPMALLVGCERVDRIRITEMLNYLEYYGADEARLSGIGDSLESGLERARRVAAGTKELVSPAILHLAERLDVQVDEIRTGGVHVAPAQQRVHVESLIIEPGTVGAVRHITEGLARGRSVIELEFVTRYDNTAGPDWPAPDGVTHRLLPD